MSLGEVCEPLDRWRQDGRRAAVATLLRVRRSAPRAVGARFAVNDEGEVAGSVSSGCVEGDLFERLQAVISGAQPEIVGYGISDEMAAAVGLSCGGEIEVLLAADDPDDPVREPLGGLLRDGAPGLLVTGVSGPIRAHRLLLPAEGPAVGTLGSPELDASALDELTSWLDVEGARLLELERSGGEVSELFVETLLPPPRLAIIGASPVAEALCQLAAYLGFNVWVIDPRETLADPSRFPHAERVLHRWPREALEEIGLDRYLNVVVLAHDGKLDVPALAAALEAGCLYVGQIGGRRTQRLRSEALEALGFTADQRSRIHGPVGLDIGARTPAEIALSVLAEMTSVRRGR